MLNTIKNTDHENKVCKDQQYDIPIDGKAQGFIIHPKNAPLNYRPINQFPKLEPDELKNGTSTLGLFFTSEKHYSTGTILEITISVRGDKHKFVGELVLVRRTSQGYEMGIWLRSQTDACRARILEQVCYIDCYLEDKQVHSVTPINSEKEIQGWVSRNAALFPA